MEPVGAPLEQIDRRGAMQLEIVGLNRALERRYVATEEQRDLAGIAAAACEGRPEILDVHEKEALREGEVFLHQAGTGKAAQRDRKHRLLVAVPDGADVGRHQKLPGRIA